MGTHFLDTRCYMLSIQLMLLQKKIWFEYASHMDHLLRLQNYVLPIQSSQRSPYRYMYSENTNHYRLLNAVRHKSTR